MRRGQAVSKTRRRRTKPREFMKGKRKRVRDTKPRIKARERIPQLVEDAHQGNETAIVELSRLAESSTSLRRLIAKLLEPFSSQSEFDNPIISPPQRIRTDSTGMPRLASTRVCERLSIRRAVTNLCHLCSQPAIPGDNVCLGCNAK